MLLQAAVDTGNLNGFQEHILIAILGTTCTAVAALVYGIVRERSWANKLDRAKVEMREEMQSRDRVHDGTQSELMLRVARIEQVLTGLDGSNGLRSEVREIAKIQDKMRTILIRMAERQDIDADLESEDRRATA